MGSARTLSFIYHKCYLKEKGKMEFSSKNLRNVQDI